MQGHNGYEQYDSRHYQGKYYQPLEGLTRSQHLRSNKIMAPKRHHNNVFTGYSDNHAYDTHHGHNYQSNNIGFDQPLSSYKGENYHQEYKTNALPSKHYSKSHRDVADFEGLRNNYF